MAGMACCAYQHNTDEYLAVFTFVKLPNVVEVLTSERGNVLKRLYVLSLQQVYIKLVCHLISLGSQVVAWAVHPWCYWLCLDACPC